MWKFAWRNLLTRPLRTALALVGLSIPILGVLGLFSVSGGLRSLIGDTLNQIQGVIVMRENSLTPVFSDLPQALGAKIAQVPGVRQVAAEILKTAPAIEGRGSILDTTVNLLNPSRSKQQKMQSLLDQPLIEGQDIPSHIGLRSSVYPRKMLAPDRGGGRFLNLSDRGQPHIVISTKLARDYPVTAADGASRPRRVGDVLRLGDKPFEIIGLYETGSMFLDTVILMSIESARDLLGTSPETVSNFYVEADEPGMVDQVASRIEETITEPRVNAQSMAEFAANFGMLMGQLDTFLMMTVSLALVVGVVGIINTMLMSTTERFAEFGVLRTNGWAEHEVLLLVTAESAFLGLLAGLIGCVLAGVGTTIANQFLEGGLRLAFTPGLIALGLGLSIVMGTIGGSTPRGGRPGWSRWRRSGWVPIEPRASSHEPDENGCSRTRPLPRPAGPAIPGLLSRTTRGSPS